ncbi:MAG: Rne/Rng family ribonuclease [Proteobacteria bacterium]|nr:Rne/Rng family ribonuclease [Desulfobulbaceae bacterium]MBU4152339.1 Rne/Rng family ribonuclease [Pseudomonadota bacterium]
MSTETPDQIDNAEDKPEAKKPRRPSTPRSRSKKAPASSQSKEASEVSGTAPQVAEPTTVASPPPAVLQESSADSATASSEPVKKPARKRKRSPAKKKSITDTPATLSETETSAAPAAHEPDIVPQQEPNADSVTESSEPVKKPGRKRRRSSAKKKSVSDTPIAPPETTTPTDPAASEDVSATQQEPVAESAPTNSEPVKKPGRKRRRSSAKKKSTQITPPPSPSESEPEPDEETEDQTKESGKPHSLKLLINADEPEECRVALLENGKLESFHVETVSREQHKGNIYKGRIVSVESNLQAAFVDIGTGKNGFLPFSEIHPEYYNREVPPDTHWKNHRIKEVLNEGQEVLVEVVKDVTGGKGASLTTYISLPGRYVVLMPGSDSHGISKKIDNENERQKLRDMLASCNIPEGVGYIIRTASDGITKTALTNDVRYQINLWSEIKDKGQTESAPALLYKEQSIIDRFLRDHFSSEIEEILVDSQDAFEQVTNFLDLLPATQRKKTTAKLHKGPRPLLNSYNIEEQIEQIFRPTVKLPSGGSIVINPTEALVAIDVNSGSTGRDKNFEETIFLANMEAAEELARQLRLRDLGGLIVVDFIDMRPLSNIKEVEKKVKSSMKRDKAKVDFTRISKFGLMEISRQRMGAPIQTGNYQPCEYCQGHGLVRSVETQALAFLRQIQTGVTRKNVATVQCLLPTEVGQYLLNKKRADLAEMEKDYRVSIVIETNAALKPAEAKIEFIKER